MFSQNFYKCFYICFFVYIKSKKSAKIWCVHKKALILHSHLQDWEIGIVEFKAINS